MLRPYPAMGLRPQPAMPAMAAMAAMAARAREGRAATSACVRPGRKLVHRSQQRPFQVPGLRDVDELGMIPRRAAHGEQLQPAAGVTRRV